MKAPAPRQVQPAFSPQYFQFKKSIVIVAIAIDDYRHEECSIAMYGEPCVEERRDTSVVYRHAYEDKIIGGTFDYRFP